MPCRDNFVAAVRLPTRGLIVLIACLLVVAQGCGGGDDGSGGGSTGGRDSGTGGATGGTSADSSTAGGGTGGQGGTGGTAGTGGADGAVTDAQGGGPADSSADASDGGPCDDGNACTTDILTGGQCAHVPVVCMALDQCHNAGTCDPATGACSNPNKTDGTACNDNNSCTQTDDCQAGVCTGSNPVVCTALDQCHEVGVCDTATGACSNPNKVDGTTCNDGDACTQTDTCVAGACTGSNPVVCTALDQCHDVGVCDTATGVCSNPNKTDGTGCDDGNLCTRSDTCVAGVCTGADPVSCSGTDECHTPGTCDPATGGCDSPSAPDGTTCNDNNPCTQASSCQLGVCTGSNPIVCTALDDCHDPGVCQTATGTCTNPNKANGTACGTDGNACTQTDTCQNGTCTGSNPIQCTASDQCHIAGTCNPATGVCSNPPIIDGALCNDNNGCTQSSTCQAGNCIGTNPIVCAPADQCHDPATCDPGTGACNYPTKANGTACSDNNFCTLTDTCQAGVCTGSNPVQCTASDQCHGVGTCNPSTGLCNNPNLANGTVCNDGNACTQTDGCLNGFCNGSNPIQCTALDSCHAPGTCNPATGVCDNPNLPNGTVCNDNNGCTQTDTCQGGACTGANLITCNPSDQCHNAGTCNPTTGACSNPPKVDGSACSDNNACTQSDTCVGGTCTGTNSVVCPTPDQCHDLGVCDPVTGACSNPAKPEDFPCNDNNACSQLDLCRSGVCLGTNVVVCSASDQCHNVGTCDPATGVCSDPARPDDAPCDDGSFCTLNETCQNGACEPAGTVTCTALDQCHDVGICNPGTGACSNPPKVDGSACSDNNACTQSDTCVAGACTGSSPVVCQAQDQCHDVGVCNPATGTCSDPLKPNGDPCTDDDACTTGDSCQLGVCMPADSVVCVSSDQCHLAGTCDPLTGSCNNPEAPDGTPCNDGLTCTTLDSCVAGACGGLPPNCDDGIACTTDQCVEPGGCQSQPNPTCGCTSDAQCEDGNPCNGVSACDLTSGNCVEVVAPVNCSPLDDQCNIGVCNPGTGQCLPQPRSDGTPCSDGNACTLTDACSSGSCIGANPLLCTASDQCHSAGVCDPLTGSCSNPELPAGTPCSDGNACTQNDACGSIGALFTCLSGPGVVCNPSGPCRDAGTCDPGTGFCSDPPSPDGTPCNDGLNCTQTDVCQSGACTGTNQVVCPPPGPCQGPGACIELPPPVGYSCSYPASPDGTPCEDGSTCTQGDACAGGACVGAVPNKCVTGPPRQPGCDPCVDQICGADPFCCQTFWDSICVGEVLSVCGSVECSCGDNVCLGVENNGNCPTDCCHDAILTNAVPSSTTGTTTGYDNSYTPTCRPSSTAPDFIFQFTAPFTGTFSFDTIGVGYDSVLAAIESCGGPELACDDDGAGYPASRIQLSLTANQTVKIVVDGYSTASGDFVLNVNQVTTCNGDNVCTPPEDRNNCYDCHCGDGTCDATENVNVCPFDCGAFCGDGVCSPALGEDTNPPCPDCACGDTYCSIPQGEDFIGCPECFNCGDGVCARGIESTANCAIDCSSCGDGQCRPSAGEDVDSYPMGCGNDCFCGDGICSSSRTPPFIFDCDCTCGDGICSPGFEDPTTCPDCSCGDGVCDPNFENRTTCFFDCKCGDGVCDSHEAAVGNCYPDCVTSGSCLMHAPCETGSQLEPGCDPAGCVGAVCNYDPTCCFDTGTGVPPTWDAHCVNIMQWACGIRCP